MTKILLDTSAYSNLLRGNSDIAKAANEADMVYMSVFVLAELFTGFKGGTKEKLNRNILNKFIDKPTVRIIEGTAETAEIFSEVKHELKMKGTPVPINDIWIASNCIETGSVLITADNHFKLIKGLRVKFISDLS